MKKEISKYITQIYTGDLERKIDDVIEYFQNLKKEHLGNYKYLKIDAQYYDNAPTEFELLGIRDETDEEYQTRINAEDINKKIKEERERKLLETLKAKYDKNN